MFEGNQFLSSIGMDTIFLVMKGIISLFLDRMGINRSGGGGGGGEGGGGEGGGGEMWFLL